MTSFLNILLHGLLGLTAVLTTIYLLVTVSVLWRRRHPVALAAAPEGVYPRVTIQIPTYNELAAIQCAARCLKFDYPGDRYEILIGDDSNKPEVSATLDRFAERHPRVQVIRRGGNSGYKPGNLNHMLSYSTGDYMLVFDSDFLPEADFLKKIVAPVMMDPGLAGVQARWRVLNPLQSSASIMGASIVYVIHTVILPFLWRFCGTSVFCGSAELVRRDLLEANGRWREGSLTEDIDYTFRVYIRNQRIGFAENVECESEVPHNFPDLFRQQMRWAYGVTRCFVDHGAGLLMSGLATGRRKMAMMLFGSGYLMTAVLVGMLIVGLLNFVMTLLPGHQPMTEWNFRLGETVSYILLSSGLLITSLSGAAVSRFGWRTVLRLVVTSYTVGVVLMLYVVRGMCIALTGKSMKWFMLKKAGNEAIPCQAMPEGEESLTVDSVLE